MSNLLKCDICGEFLSYPTNDDIIGEMVYNFNDPVSNKYYHKKCLKKSSNVKPGEIPNQFCPPFTLTPPITVNIPYKPKHPLSQPEQTNESSGNCFWEIFQNGENIAKIKGYLVLKENRPIEIRSESNEILVFLTSDCVVVKSLEQ